MFYFNDVIILFVTIEKAFRTKFKIYFQTHPDVPFIKSKFLVGYDRSINPLVVKQFMTEVFDKRTGEKQMCS